MTVQEYIDKHSKDLLSSNRGIVELGASNLFEDMLEEVRKKMRCSQDPTNIKIYCSFLDSQNKKWNAVARRLEKPILKENGFKEYFEAGDFSPYEHLLND